MKYLLILLLLTAREARADSETKATEHWLYQSPGLVCQKILIDNTSCVVCYSTKVVSSPSVSCNWNEKSEAK